MANLTLTVDSDLLRRARIRALEQGTSVNAVVRSYLEAFANPMQHAKALDRLLNLAQTTSSGSGPAGRTWTRDELHER